MKLRFTVASVIGLAAAGCTRDDHELAVKVRYDSGSNVVVAPKTADEQKLTNDEQNQNGQLADGVLLAQATGSGGTGSTATAPRRCPVATRTRGQAR